MTAVLFSCLSRACGVFGPFCFHNKYLKTKLTYESTSIVHFSPVDSPHLVFVLSYYMSTMHFMPCRTNIIWAERVNSGHTKTHEFGSICCSFCETASQRWICQNHTQCTGGSKVNHLTCGHCTGWQLGLIRKLTSSLKCTFRLPSWLLVYKKQLWKLAFGPH